MKRLIITIIAFTMALVAEAQIHPALRGTVLSHISSHSSAP